MDMNKLMKDVQMKLEGDQLVVTYESKVLGKITVDWQVVAGEKTDEVSTPVQTDDMPVKQYVEGCDLGWC